MNVVDHGILSLLALMTLAVAVAAPLVLAALRRQMVAVVGAGAGRLRLPVHPDVLTPTTPPLRIPTDVIPAHQAWRAPPTVWRDQADHPTDSVGGRSD